MHALSHTTGYAIVALSFIGCSDAPWVQTREIAEQTGIPKPYLSKILHALGKAGLLRTKRGIGGGVALSRPAREMTLLDVANAVEPLATEPRCILGMSTCSDEKPCPMHDFWKATRERVGEQLARTTLAQVAEHQQAYTGFRAPSLAELIDDLPMQARMYRTKPTSRFMRKFGQKD